MSILMDRVRVISAYLVELLCRGLPRTVGTPDHEVLFVLDGVGGFQFGPLLVRKALRQQQVELATAYYRWQYGLPGEIWTDLMWIRRNRVMAVHFARRLLAFRRAHPSAVMHILAFSGAAGIAVFALEQTRERCPIGTLILACPALSPDYNLAPALRAVQRCYALVSRRDSAVLGLGTRIFGTTDRVFTPAAGCVGFRIPDPLGAEDVQAYDRMGEIHWSEEFRHDGHSGGHVGWISDGFLRRHLLPILRGQPTLPVRAVARRCVDPTRNIAGAAAGTKVR